MPQQQPPNNKHDPKIGRQLFSNPIRARLHNSLSSSDRMRRETLLRGKSVHIQYVHDGIVLRSRRESNWRSHSSEFTMWIICSVKNWITDRNENRRESSMWVTLYKPYFMVFGCFTLYTHFTISLRICIVDNGKFAICDYHIFGMDFNQFLFCTPRLEPFVTCMARMQEWNINLWKSMRRRFMRCSTFLSQLPYK